MILCCGEALIDMIGTQDESGADCYLPCLGGAVFNTALALGRLEQEVGMLSGMSTDMFGKKLAAALEENNVDQSHVVFSNRPTTLAFVELKNGQAKYRFYDENSAGRMLKKSDFKSISKATKALYFSGISLVFEPCATAYTELAVAQSDQQIIMVDPNIRPNFIEDEGAYRARLDRLLAHTDIIKLSQEDLDWIDLDATPLENKIKKLHEAGISLVILTCGADGAKAFHTSGIEVEVASKPVEVKDTIGAGDSFSAGILAHLSNLGALSKPSLKRLNKNEIENVLEFATSVCAVTVSRTGANPPWLSELEC